VTGGRLVTGTSILAAQLRAWLAAGDLTTEKGKPLAGAALMKARAGRALGGFALAWFVGGILLATGLILWGPVALWAFSALVASAGMEKPKTPATEPEQEEEPEALAHPGERRMLLSALDEITAGRSGIHLVWLYPLLREWGTFADLDDAKMRQLLTLHGIPVQQITADGVRGRNGVKRADIEALLNPTPPPLSAAPLGEEDRADLRKSSSSSGSGEGPEGVTCMAHELGDDTLAMLSGEVSDR